MITLYGFGPAFGLPDPSPFVTKAEMVLKLASVPYRMAEASMRKAPKGKVPYLDDDGQLIGDSTLIRWHVERKYGVDLDRGLDQAQRGIAWAFEKMMEDQLYWAFLDSRWVDEENFQNGPAKFFNKIPALVRPLIVGAIRRSIRKSLRAQGMGRHDKTEIEALGARSLDAMAAFLCEKAYAMGDEPTGLDATLFAFAAGALCPRFETPLRTAAERHDNLKRYVGRVAARFYPEFGPVAGIAPAA